MNTDNIPYSILYCLKAIRNMIELESEGLKECVYKKNGKCDECLYYIYRAEGNTECLYDMIQDSISSLTTE